MPARRKRFLWQAHPIRGLAETWIVGMAMLWVLSYQVGVVSPFVLGNGVLFVCGLCGMWSALRIRLPGGSRLRSAVAELAVGLALSLVMGAGLSVPARWLGWEGIWQESSLGPVIAAALLWATGPGYLLARLGVRVWLRWQHLRRRRMLWAITHAHLTLVLLVACLVALAIFALGNYSAGSTLLQPERANLLTSFLGSLLHSVFPAVSIVAILTIMALVAILPPSALFSYVVARGTTRRLEALVAAARALREGNYGARVEVVGEDEVAQLQADLNAMAEELERTLHDLEVQRDTVTHLLEARRQLVATVSHELRTPVATVRALLESALDRREEEAPASLRHDLEVVQGEVLRLQGLIDDLFALSQAEAAGLAVDCRPEDVGLIAAGMVEALAPLAWKGGRVEVVAELPPDLPPAVVDRARLEQVLANLLRNAIRYTPPGGIVAVVARPESDAVRIEVKDTGEGIAPEDLPHVWERFYHGPNGGAGLGLALARELTEAMGGSISVESTPGRGSCFALRLPRAGSVPEDWPADQGADAGHRIVGKGLDKAPSL